MSQLTQPIVTGQEAMEREAARRLDDYIAKLCQEPAGRIMHLPEGRSRRVYEKIIDRVIVEDNGCWTWTGPHSGYHGRGKLYPRMCLDGATVAVHRAMFVLWNGPIPPRKQVDHTCRNRACVNPDHLEMVTHRENQKRRDSCV